MKRNSCARCGKKEVFGRVFESITYENDDFFLCVDCAQILYKAEDARKENRLEDKNELISQFRGGIKESAIKSLLINWLDNR